MGFGNSEAVVLSGAAGGNATCEIAASTPTATTGTLFCSGANGVGQLGLGTNIDAHGFVVVPTLVARKFSKVVMSQGHTCALEDTGDLWCWGTGGNGQLGTGTTNSNMPLLVTANVLDVAVGDSHTCATFTGDVGAAGIVKCWGNNSEGQLADGTITSRSTPTPVAFSFRPTPEHGNNIQLTAGRSHTCALLDDANRTAVCWGRNLEGQLGNGINFRNQALPNTCAIAGEGANSRIVAGQFRTYLIKETGEVFAWGSKINDAFGSTGNQPLAYFTTSAFASVSLSDAFDAPPSGTAGAACGVLITGEAKCWGASAGLLTQPDGNDNGQLGNGTTFCDPDGLGTPDCAAIPGGDNVPGTPVDLFGEDRVALSTFTGFDHSCAVIVEGISQRLYCWGDNFNGQVGDGTQIDRLIPTALPDPVGPVCGDATCNGGEDASTCAADCPESCGDQLCTGTETNATCPGDCPAVCGDTVCNGTETNASCPGDCPPVCGDTVCNGTETNASCPGDCPPICGDSVCNGVETHVDCPEDCPPVCGDTICDGTETNASCPGDCPPRCDDGVCNGTETRASCPTDCPVVCGDTLCTDSETHASCPVDCPVVCGDDACDTGEDAGNCPEDCPTICGDTFCEGGETSISCPADCPAACGDGACNGTETTATCAQDCPAPVFVKQAVKVSASAGTTCAIVLQTNGDRQLYCWGYGGYGQIGDGFTIDRSTPTLVAGMGNDVRDVAVGTAHVCAIAGTGPEGGIAKCWSNDNSVGQVGDGTTTRRLVPTTVLGGEAALQIATGDSHSCITTASAIKCWGWNAFGQLGDGTATTRLTAVTIQSGLTNPFVSLGKRHSCSQDGNGSRKPKCWGYNVNGALSRGHFFSPGLLPTPIVDADFGSAVWGPVRAAGETTLVVHGSTLRYAGTNVIRGVGQPAVRSTMGTLFAGTTFAPRQPSGSTWTSFDYGVAAYEPFFCALRANRSPWCFGNSVSSGSPLLSSNAFVQLGSTGPGFGGAGCSAHFLGGLPCEGTSLGGGDFDATMIATADYHGCFIVGGGATHGAVSGLYCWGAGANGRLGNGQTVNVGRPTLVPLP
ncbi:MAG: hypothetical protein ABI867_09195 [Kofleriaceae bacterium]